MPTEEMKKGVRKLIVRKAMRCPCCEQPVVIVFLDGMQHAVADKIREALADGLIGLEPIEETIERICGRTAILHPVWTQEEGH